jgi:hypothetical protein
MPDFDHIQNGVTWLGGPTHELQKQHVPGYAGHVHGLHAENVYGRNFARVTAECLNNRHNKGINVDNVTALLSRTRSTGPPTRTSTSSPINAEASL